MRLAICLSVLLFGGIFFQSTSKTIEQRLALKNGTQFPAVRPSSCALICLFFLLTPLLVHPFSLIFVIFLVVYTLRCIGRRGTDHESAGYIRTVCIQRKRHSSGKSAGSVHRPPREAHAREQLIDLFRVYSVSIQAHLPIFLHCIYLFLMQNDAKSGIPRELATANSANPTQQTHSERVPQIRIFNAHLLSIGPACPPVAILQAESFGRKNIDIFITHNRYISSRHYALRTGMRRHFCSLG